MDDSARRDLIQEIALMGRFENIEVLERKAVITLHQVRRDHTPWQEVLVELDQIVGRHLSRARGDES